MRYYYYQQENRISLTLILRKMHYNYQVGRIETKIFDLHKTLCFIPSLAIHLSDEKERKGDRVEFNKETQLLPIFGLGSLDEKESEVDIYNRHPKELVDLICKEAGVSAESVLDMDCYLYDPTVPSLFSRIIPSSPQPSAESTTNSSSAARSTISR